MHDAYPPQRRSVRLQGYDYAQPGSYYVTVCVAGMRCVLANVRGGKVQLTRLGGVVDACWAAIPEHFPGVSLDEHIAMPNHFHGIVRIDAERAEWSTQRFRQLTTGSLSTIVRSFKAAATRAAREAGLWDKQPLWRRGFYEHVIRPSEEETIRNYILDNPIRWQRRLDGRRTP